MAQAGRALLKWAEERSLDLERLESRPASLEDVFLAVAQGDVTDLVDL